MLKLETLNFVNFLLFFTGDSKLFLAARVDGGGCQSRRAGRQGKDGWRGRTRRGFRLPFRAGGLVKDGLHRFLLFPQAAWDGRWSAMLDRGGCQGGQDASQIDVPQNR
jgi:hypothetical protein